MLHTRLKACVLLLAAASILLNPGIVKASSSGESRPLSPGDYPVYTRRNDSRDIVLLPNDTVLLENALLEKGYCNEKGLSVLSRENSKIEWRFSAVAGSYTLRVEYCPMKEGGASIIRSIAVNGREANETIGIAFPRHWEDIRDRNGEFLTDASGNQLVPQQRELWDWIDTFLFAQSGFSSSPLSVLLKDGENTLTFSGDSGALAIRKITLLYDYKVPTYEAIRIGYPDIHTGAKVLSFEAEKTSYKSNAALTAKSDFASASVSPHDAFKQKMNVLGGGTWSMPGDYVVWRFSVPVTGLYAITFKARKNTAQGYTSYRRLYLDGMVPFDECNSLPFIYSQDWRLVTLGNGDQPYLFYIEAGKTHELKLEATIGDIAPILNDASEALLRLNALYRKLMMIIGSSPDIYRDYELEKKAPDVIQALRDERDAVKGIYNRLLAKTEQKGGAFVTLDLILDVLDKMTSRPEQIPRHYGRFKTYLGSYATWLSTSCSSPLQLDAFYIHNAGSRLPDANAGWFKNLVHFFQRIFASFVVDYNLIGSSEPSGIQSENITVWMTGGRDQFQVMKALLAEGGIQKQNISVDLKLVNPGILLKSIIAGRCPDVMLSDSPSEIINYALRGAVADLKQFEDLPDVLKWFDEKTTVPFELEGGLYALPTTMTYNLMFYRKDILNTLSIEPPQTWDDVTRTISILSKNGLEFGLPRGIDTFFSFLTQTGGNIYNPSGSAVAFDNQTGIKAFKKWTRYYADYGQPYDFDFQNRFRTGEMPIGIAPYSLYSTLVIAAPEITGLWDFTLLPGTVRKDGTLDRTSCLTVTGSLILESSQKKEASWRFLKWWSSSEVQVNYGNGVERILGASGRYTTANTEAMNLLPWTGDQKRVLNEQLKHSRAIPEVPGGYLMPRMLDYAFKSVVIQGNLAKNTLLSYAKTINDELTAKRREFGLPTEGED